MTDDDRRILDCESRTWLTVGRKERAMREIGMSPAAYFTRLNMLLDDRDAVEYAPMVVTRLRRMRDAR